MAMSDRYLLSLKQSPKLELVLGFRFGRQAAGVSNDRWYFSR